MSNLKQWVDDELHTILGMSDNLLTEYIVDLAKKSTSVSNLIVDLQKSADLQRTPELDKFAADLFVKLPKKQTNAVNSKEVQIRAAKESEHKNKSYQFIPEPKVKAPKKKSRKKSSESEDETVVVQRKSKKKSSKKVSVSNEDEWQEAENERLRDQQDKDEFVKRLKDRDKDDTRNIVEDSYKHKYENAKKTLQLNEEDKRKMIPELRKQSRRDYAKKRKEMKLEESFPGFGSVF